jgi:hypothetical protein
MTSGPLLLYHLGLILLPLAALALTRFRLTPALLLMAVLHHHPMEPMPGDHEPPPICCALAQSTEAEPGLTVAGTIRIVRLRPLPLPISLEPLSVAKPAIRAPPAKPSAPPPVPWAPVLRAA